jgi:hypothetical protein
MTDFLFARASFWEGFSRVLDIGGTLTEYNRSRDGAEADRRAIQSDWAAVGRDMGIAIDTVAQGDNAHQQGGEQGGKP